MSNPVFTTPYTLLLTHKKITTNRKGRKGRKEKGGDARHFSGLTQNYEKTNRKGRGSALGGFPDLKRLPSRSYKSLREFLRKSYFIGTHRGELQGIPPTGKQIVIPVFHIDRLIDDKLVEHWGQSDLLSLMQQVGMITIPSAGLILRKFYQAIATIINKLLRLQVA